MSDYTAEELKTLLGKVGTNVKIHRSVVFFNPSHIFLGSNVRIDCFCILSAGSKGIHLEDYIHIGASSHFFGHSGKITFESFSGTSSRVSLFTSSDDFTDGHLTNPTVPMNYRKVREGDITLRKHALIGCGSIIMPSVEIGLGGSVGALSFVNESVPEFTVIGGVPAKKIGERKKLLLDLEAQFMQRRHEG